MKNAAGFTMIEIMVALLILLIGLLGLAGIMVTAQRAEVEAYQRKQAMVLLQDMLDRITANPLATGCYAVTDASSGAPAFGTGYSGTYVCGSGSVSQQARASADLQAWNNALLGTSEKNAAGTAVGAIIDARGCVSTTASGVYVISIAWRGLSSTRAPLGSLTCGKNQYKDTSNNVDEATRRVISVTIRIANLAV
ncbi:MAG TPA: type IV pilus modification protein PilV [Burkholderiales bacterium]|jgi:type IV pilus assembly protein PilV